MQNASLTRQKNIYTPAKGPNTQTEKAAATRSLKDLVQGHPELRMIGQEDLSLEIQLKSSTSPQDQQSQRAGGPPGPSPPPFPPQPPIPQHNPPHPHTLTPNPHPPRPSPEHTCPGHTCDPVTSPAPASHTSATPHFARYRPEHDNASTNTSRLPPLTTRAPAHDSPTPTTPQPAQHSGRNTYNTQRHRQQQQEQIDLSHIEQA
ncbi:uncharacterized protein LOC126984115 [Eriocheir sinensis]|uniref:uncharacterized protein LOC126984115 n=1 Tax=Eriocheir sinensis TaxID=95602 RepID=UPI0021C60578|nr:uncharacterized protein LOC126984115 [Eriocheir sinensis]